MEKGVGKSKILKFLAAPKSEDTEHQGNDLEAAAAGPSEVEPPEVEARVEEPPEAKEDEEMQPKPKKRKGASEPKVQL